MHWASATGADLHGAVRQVPSARLVADVFGVAAAAHVDESVLSRTLDGTAHRVASKRMANDVAVSCGGRRLSAQQAEKPTPR